MQRVLMLSVSVAVMTWAASAGADSPKLKGAYDFTGSATCIVSSSGFDQKLRPNSGSEVWLQSFAVKGTRTFNGDGHGTVEGSAMSVDFGTNHTSASSDNFQFSFTYSVDGDGGWKSDIDGNLTGTVMSGPRAGTSFSISGFPEFKGSISQNGSTLTAATLTPTVETITYSDANETPDPVTGPSSPTPGVDTDFDTVYRICHRSRVLINLPNGQ